MLYGATHLPSLLTGFAEGLLLAIAVSMFRSGRDWGRGRRLWPIPATTAGFIFALYAAELRFEAGLRSLAGLPLVVQAAASLVVGFAVSRLALTKAVHLASSHLPN